MSGTCHRQWIDESGETIHCILDVREEHLEQGTGLEGGI